VEPTGDLRKFHTEKLHDLYAPPNTITVIKSNRIK